MPIDMKALAAEPTGQTVKGRPIYRRVDTGPVLSRESAALAIRCTEIADQVEPNFRRWLHDRNSCVSDTPKRWQAAWDAACIALSGDPAEYR